MASGTIFKGFNQPVENKALLIIIKDIKEGKYKTEVEQIRSLILEWNTEKADKLKKQLPAFTPSGTYEGGRKANLLTMYSGFVHLDLDKLKPDQLEDVFQKIIQIPYTYACFRSPSGNGLKVLIEVTSTAEHHDKAYKQVQTYYETELALQCDPKCKDITRLCFVSYDPDAYLNFRCQKFKVEGISELAMEHKSSPILGEDIGGGHTANNQDSPGSQPQDQKPPVSGDDLFTQNLFLQTLQFTEQKESYHDGNRNNFIYLLACNCNRSGIPEESALELITTQFDLSQNEIAASIKSAYHNHHEEFANSANFANFATLQTANHTLINSIEEDSLKNTPYIPDDVYYQLPSLLKRAVFEFKDKRERDVFMTGALAILSGCLPGVKGVYSRQTVFPNLFAFIIAPAASGKGVLKFSKSLADKYHDQLLQSSRNAQEQYEIDMNDYKQHQRFRKKGDAQIEMPVEPPFKVLFIPANSSYAKILTHLEKNMGEGIICETEADTMGNVLKQEWGGYSDMLRKAFHHEGISSSKKANNEYIQVNEPRLSVALSGTPAQVTGLIASAEDGLFSRFIFYAYKVHQQWRDVSPFANETNLTDHFVSLSEDIYKMVLFLNETPTIIELTQEQWNKLNEKCSQWLNDVVIFSGENSGSVVKRLGLILYRITMIFTALRKFEKNDKSENFICSDSDFESSLLLTETFLHHSLLMFHNLPNQNHNTSFRSPINKQKFYEALPDSFKRADAVALGKEYNLSARSVDSFLSQSLGTLLYLEQYGTYTKHPPAL
jgi:hypothetical protein